MKKLMIAAALAAAMVGTASAACADPTPCAKCVWGYKLMLVAKTTVPGRVSNVYAKACGCYRKPTMGKIYGYWFGKTGEVTGTCGDNGCGCNNFADSSIDQNFLLWKAWNKAPMRATLDTNTIGAFKQLDRIGYKDRSTVEMCWSFTFTDEPGLAQSAAQLTLAGFGKAAHRADGTVAIKSANGYFAGQMLSYCVDAGETVCGDPLPSTIEPSHYWAICEDASVAEVIDDPLTAAYGKWQMVWDSQLVDRLTKQGFSANYARPSTAYPIHPDFVSAE